MITFNIVNNKHIAGSINGEAFNTNYSKALWDKMVQTQAELEAVGTMAEAKAVFEKFKSLLAPVSTEAAISEITKEIVYNEKTSSYHLQFDGKTSPIPLPKSFVDRIKLAYEKNLPVAPLIKFVIRALRNPNIHSGVDAARFLDRLCGYVAETFVSPVLKEKFIKEGYSDAVATEMATVPQTPITQEGLLSTKKVVTPLYDRQRYKFVEDADGNPKRVLRDEIKKTIDENTGAVTISDPEFAEDWVFEPKIMGQSGDAFYSGDGKDAPLGHEIRIGKEVRLPSWKHVNCNNSQSCVPGLHTGNHNYIQSFEDAGSVTIDMFVDPANIGAIPNYDAPGVLRCLAMFPYGIKSRKVENRNIYHSSKYAALNDARWAEYKAEIMAKYDEELEALKAALEAKKQKLG